MSLRHILKIATREDWLEGLWWLVTNLLGGLLPIWGALFLFLLYSQPISLGTFIARGELALYCASILSVGLYVTTKGWGGHLTRRVLTPQSMLGSIPPEDLSFSFPGAVYFNVPSIALLMASMLIFAGTISVTIPNFGVPLNQNFLLYGTLVIFSASTAITYVITVVETVVVKVTALSLDQWTEVKQRSLEALNSAFDQPQKGEETK